MYLQYCKSVQTGDVHMYTLLMPTCTYMCQREAKKEEQLEDARLCLFHPGTCQQMMASGVRHQFVQSTVLVSLGRHPS